MGFVELEFHTDSNNEYNGRQEINRVVHVDGPMRGYLESNRYYKSDL